MDNVKTKVIFEHPLNEKMRTWLRIEFLVDQLNSNKNFNQSNALLFFHSLSELLEIVERNDIRSDLIKDIDEQKQKLIAWLDVKGVDTTLLHSLINQINSLLTALNVQSKLGLSLKSNPFISAIRKRLTIPGGCCSFDLPWFYLWLQKNQQQRDQQVNLWLDSLTSLSTPLSFYLRLVRQSTVFKSFTYNNNFYQNSIATINMLRIRIATELDVFPQVSGNSSCYTIRFMRLDSAQTENKIPCYPIEFELASA